MYEPRYKLTHAMVSNLVKFEVERKGITDLPLDDDLVTTIRIYSNTLDLFHLGHLFGASITLNTAKRVASGKALDIDDVKGQYLTNFRNAIEYIFATQAAYGIVQPSLLLHLNKILIKDIAEEWDAKYRTEQVSQDKESDPWLQYHDASLPTANIEGEAISVISWFGANQSKIHPLILISCVIYRLIRIAPFAKANKLTILAICKFLFFKTGYLLDGYYSVLKNFDIFEKEYQEVWKKAIEEGDDCTLWIEKFIESCAAEMVTLREYFSKQIETHREKGKQPFLDLNRRQLKILRYLQNIPVVKREEYVQMMDVSTMTAYRDLNELLKKGLLRMEGEGRGTRYMLASR